MAVVRARTSPPYALIIFVITTVIFAALWVLSLTQFGELNKRVEKAEAAAKPYISDNEKKTADQVRDTIKGTSNRPTAYAAAMAQRDQAVKAITGKDDTSASAADLAVAQASTAVKDTANFVADLKSIPPEQKNKITQTDSLLTALTQLRLIMGGADVKIKQLEAQAKSAESALEEKRKEAAQEAEIAKKNSDAQILALNNLQTDKAAADAKGPEIEARLQAAMTKQAEGYDKQIRDLNLVIAQDKVDMTKALAQIDFLRDELTKTRMDPGRSFAAEPSGKIIRTSLVLGEVSIGLGSADHITRGITFVVFDSRSGVRTEPGLDLGKASIEVTEVHEHDSLCRVTRSARNQRVEIGDVIYNLVYSQQKSRKFKFAIYGDFDLDGDGNATSAERTRLIRMIEDWGGQVDTLSVEEMRDKTGQVMLDKDGKPIKHPMVKPETDFLILGTEPNDLHDTTNLELVSSEQMDELRAKRDEWLWVQADGKRSGVSVLNANRFLHLVGYFNTTIVHN